MAVKIRFARLGCKHRPFYRIVVADSESRRDGKFIQVVGFYDPLAAKEDTKKMSLNYDRAKYWLSVGAQPSDPVRRILMQAGLIEPPSMVVMARKGGEGGSNDDQA
ncbi:unnamed protein product [Linum trigynum]|uniref:30S ribosomal protein S16 n=1 Tax=Linum trigynum TaxID=586398 RepID=A0AAV2D3D6_9ROSI